MSFECVRIAEIKCDTESNISKSLLNIIIFMKIFSTFMQMSFPFLSSPLRRSMYTNMDSKTFSFHSNHFRPVNSFFTYICAMRKKYRREQEMVLLLWKCNLAIFRLRSQWSKNLRLSACVVRIFAHELNIMRWWWWWWWCL